MRLLGGGGWLDGHRPINAKGDGPQGDVAESILIQVGAARHSSQAPGSPTAWRYPPHTPQGAHP